jgi:putative ABC transport system ATP-binding protein
MAAPDPAVAPEAVGREPAPIVALSDVHKIFQRGRETISVLAGIDLEIARPSYVSFMGPSGSGKSTLLNIIAGLDRASNGSVRVADVELTTLSDGELARFRATTIGFVFQSYNLMPVLTALENVELPLLLTSLSRRERRERAETALKVVGLADRRRHLPRELSGGQEQRVAIARAIVVDPQIIVADEPTGDLDRKSALDVLDLFDRFHRDFNKTIVMVTHDPAAAKRATIQRTLDKGRLD